MNKITIIMLMLIIALSFTIVGCSSQNGNTNTAPTGNVVASTGQNNPAAPTASEAQVTIQNKSNANTVPSGEYTNIQSASDDFNSIYTALNYT